MRRLILFAACVVVVVIVAAAFRESTTERSTRPSSSEVEDAVPKRTAPPGPEVTHVEPAESADRTATSDSAATRTVRGVVRDRAGEPVEGAVVELIVPTDRERRQVSTDAEGRYEFADVPPTAQGGLVVWSRDGSARARKLDGGTECDFVLVPTRTVHGRVRDEEDRPAKGAVVVVRYVGSLDRHEVRTETDENGEFEFADRELAVQELVVFRPGFESFRHESQLPALRRRLGAEEEVGTLVLPKDGDRRAALTGHVIGPDGQPACKGAFVRVWRDGEPSFTLLRQPDEQGAFEVLELEPGTYRLEVHRDGNPTLHLRDIEVGPDGLDLGVLRLPPPAFIWVLDGGDEVAVYSIDQRIRYNVRKGCSEELNAGRYLLFAGSPGQVIEIELLEGQTQSLMIAPKPIGRAALEFLRNDSGPAGDIVLTVLDTKDRRVFEAGLEVGETTSAIELIEGGYLLRAIDSQGREGRASFDLVAGGTAPVRVLLRHPD